MRFFCEQVGLDIPIGSSKTSEKYSSGSVHHALLKKYEKSLDGTSDGPGKDLIRDTLRRYPATELLIIGPPSNVGRFLAENSAVVLQRSTMQGGFLGYDLHPHARVRLPQFEGKTWMPTFNMNGDRKGTDALFRTKVNTRQFCGKNVCHTILYNLVNLEGMSKPRRQPQSLPLNQRPRWLSSSLLTVILPSSVAICAVVW